MVNVQITIRVDLINKIRVGDFIIRRSSYKNELRINKVERLFENYLVASSGSHQYIVPNDKILCKCFTHNYIIARCKLSNNEIKSQIKNGELKFTFETSEMFYNQMRESKYYRDIGVKKL